MKKLALVAGVALCGAWSSFANPTLRIMPIGDSITCGHSSEPTAGYRGLLWNKLKTAGYAVDYVGTQKAYPAADVPDMDIDHEGHGGWLITDTTGADHGVLDHLPFWMKQIETPDVVLVHLGTNDSGEPDFGVQGVVDMEKTLEVLRAFAPKAHVLLSTLMWRNDEARYARIQAFNAGLDGLVTLQRKRGQKIALVDMHAAVAGGDTNFADGLHPNVTGYGLMTDAWLAAIEAIYPDPATLAEAAVDVTPSTDAYVESHGKRSVNLGYFMTPQSRIEVDFQYPTKPTGGILFGPWDNGCELSSICWNDSGVFAFSFGDGGLHNIQSKIALDASRHTAVIDFPNARVSLEQNGTEQWYSEPTTAHSNTAAWPIVLFGATNDADGNGKQFVSVRIYSVKIYEDGKLVHDFIPATKGCDTGFLDVLTGEYKGSQGDKTGGVAPALTASAGAVVVEEDSYVESLADSASAGPTVNLNYFMTPKSRIEVDYQYPTTPTGNILFGPWSGGCGLADGFWNVGGKFAFLVGDDPYKSVDTVFNCDALRHTAVIDNLNKKMRMVQNGVVQTTQDFPSGKTCTNTANWPMVLFGSTKNAQGEGKQCVSARIFSVKIYEDNEIKHDFRPCVKGRDAGFRDSQTGGFVYGKGPRDLVASGNCPRMADDVYVESKSGQTLNTGYCMKNTSRIEVDFQYPTTPKDGILFGPYDAGAKLSTICWNSGENFCFSYGDDGHHHFSSGVKLDDQRHTAVIDVLHNELRIEHNGIVQWRSNPTGVTLNNNAEWPIVLFGATANAAGEGKQTVKARIYSVKIYENDALVHNWVASVVDGVPMFVDTEGGATLCDPKKAFAGGGQVDMADAYVESDGTQVLNTDYFVTTGTRIEADFQPLDMTEGKLIYGAWSANSGIRYCGWHDGISLKCILGGGGKSPNHLVGTLDLKRHVSVLDIRNLKLHLVTGGVTNNTFDVTDAGLSADEKALHPMGVFGGLSNAEGTSPNMAGKSRIFAVRIYENEELVREFLPYKNNDEVGLRDVLTGKIALKHSASVANPKIGGCGWGPDHAAFYEEPASGVVPVMESLTLTAFAPGAVGYQWYKDGVAIPGAIMRELTIPWKRRAASAQYAVKAVFDNFGTRVERMSAAATVTMERAGSIILVK